MNPSIWITLYLASLAAAEDEQRTLYHSRIDGALLPWRAAL
mgnify:CR=1 FL=1